ncbi:antitoxin [Streptomonospora mangrovi]
MGAFDKFKDAAGDHGDQVAKGVDKAEEFAKDRTGGKYDDKIDKAGDSATEYLRRQAQQDRARGGSGDGQGT